MSKRLTRWSLAAGVTIAVTLLAIYPVVYLRSLRGKDWNGSFAYLQGDELLYAAYVNSLRTGRPRRNNPYTRDQDQPAAPLGESAHSIQFVPPYAIAMMARALGLSTSAAFAVLLILVAIGAALILFWLILSVTGDERLAAIGVLVVLCLGSVPTLWGLLQILRGLPADFSHLRFLRRYAPSATFPFLLGFFALVWQMLRTSYRSASYVLALLAGMLFSVLVFSYFYFWTAALAWLACLGLLWLIARPDGWQQGLKLVGIEFVLAILPLVPYAWLLTRRAPNQVSVTLLSYTHAPDFMRVPLLASLALIALVVGLNRCGRFDLRQRSSLLAMSFVLLPVILFNQQIVTGLSLQPTHYEVFVANYSVLLATVLIVGQGARSRLPGVGLLLGAILCLAWGMFEVRRSAAKFTRPSITRDEATPAANRLVALARSSAVESTLILATDPVVADYLPTIAPQPLLWAPHLYGFAGVTPAEDKRRLLAFLYYTGVHFDHVDAERFVNLDPERKLYFSSLLGTGRSRTDRSLSSTWTPITAEEFEIAQRAHTDFGAAFDREMASHPTLTYVLMSKDKPVDLSNLDRWYERIELEQIGSYVLYRVRLRP